ncbi:MAG: DeoR/GlpR transcriptional regulator [Candidatus Hydrogenedentes bacterium]|nr:DeoR/GlpR transcriptional regulator [Candidatus Hydrogenedentota bacterium]
MAVDKNKLLAPQRLEQLQAVVGEMHVARVDELCAILEVSPATVRRDLEVLEQRGLVRRVHGGAVAVGRGRDERLFNDKASLAAEEKERIARRALDFVKSNDTIYLDGGSTVVQLARLLKEYTSLTVVTNSLRAAVELADGGPELVLIGGRLRRLSQTVVGPMTRFLLEELRIDKAFMGTLGLTVEDGMTTTDPDEAYTKELVIARAREVVLLADSSKIGQVTFAHAGSLKVVDTLITDSGLEVAMRKRLEKAGLAVVVV